ncbi:MAG TPA: Asp-tRNA(Asn)/Glu-tRNA(Gln) amidotransferase subunit GatC [Flavobacteriales bacterium]
MKIDDAILDRIAELARLDVSDPQQRAKTLEGMQRVFNFVERLNEVDTAGVEPLMFLNADEQDVLREDVAAPGLDRTEILRNAPAKDSDYFKVPRVVGN